MTRVPVDPSEDSQHHSPYAPKETRVSTYHQSVWRQKIPIDDQPHDLLPGTVVFVAAQREFTTPMDRYVDVWVEVIVSDGQPMPRSGPAVRVQVYGTGHPMSARAMHRGSVIDGPFVWHLYELPFGSGGGA